MSSPAPALVDHRPLRYRKGQDLCPGNDKPFSIKRNIALGLEITTDRTTMAAIEPPRSGARACLAIAFQGASAEDARTFHRRRLTLLAPRSRLRREPQGPEEWRSTVLYWSIVFFIVFVVLFVVFFDVFFLSFFSFVFDVY